MIVIVTLTNPGADTGPFNLFSSVDLVTPLATGVLKSALVAGYTLNSVPDLATYIRVTSTGTCTNSLNINITNPTTTTTTSTSTSTSTTSTSSTTTTSTTTAAPSHPYSFRLSTGYSTSPLACGDGAQALTVYGDNGNFLANDFFYVASTGSTKFNGNDLYYNNVDTYVYAQISTLGTITDSGVCP